MSGLHVTQGNLPATHGLLDLIVNGPTWDGAVCRRRDKNPELWFSDAPDSIRLAKALCAGCPVNAQCAQYGIDHREQGVWGGLSDKDRAELRKAAGPEPTVTDRHCEREGCEQFLTTWNPRAKYCSNRCRQLANPDRSYLVRRCIDGCGVAVSRSSKSGRCQPCAARVSAHRRNQSGGFVTAATNPWRLA